MRSRILRKFLLSNFIILLIPLWFSAFVQFRIASLFTNESTEAQLAAIRSYRDTIDVRLQEIENLAQQITLNRHVRRYIEENDPYRPETIFLASEVLKDFLQYKNLNVFVSEFYVYFLKSDSIITHSSKYESQLFLREILDSSGGDEKAWKKRLIDTFTTGEFLTTYSREFSEGHQVVREFLTYIKSIVPGEGGKPEATIVILIDRNNLRGLLRHMAGKGRSFILAQGSVVIESSHDEGFPPPLYQQLSLTEGTFAVKLEHQKVQVVYASSRVIDWKYTTVIPIEVFMSRTRGLYTFSVLALLAALAVGGLASVLAAKKNYNPLKIVSEYLSSYIGKNMSHATDEIELIRHTIERTIEEDRGLREKLNMQQSVIRANFLQRLLKGWLESENSDVGSLAAYGIVFQTELFGVIQFRMDRPSSIEQRPAKDYALLNLVFIDLMETTAKEFGLGFAVETENRIFSLLFNAKEDAPIETVKQNLFNIARTVSSTIERKYREKLIAGISRIHRGIENISLAYRDALASINYLMVKGEGTILDYEKISEGDRSFYFPLDVEKDLLNFVVAGDWENASKLLEYIFHENFEKRNLSYQSLHVIFYELMGTAIKTLQKVKIEYSELFPQGPDPFEKLFQCQSVREIHDAIMETYATICSYVNGRKKSHNETLKSQILAYLQEHYCEKTFSQTMMASALDITSSYLSYFFKEQFGENMVDYVNKMRISRAKELFLRYPERPLSAIADEVGCQSDKALIRIFKIYEGVTPGKYRDGSLTLGHGGSTTL